VIVLVGFMGAGKTTVGQLVADKLGVRFLDSDHVIEERTGRRIPDIFTAAGEPGFRELEHQVVAGLLAGSPAVLALGGGAAAYPATRSLLASAGTDVVFLRVGFSSALDRVGGDTGRPMLARPDIADVFAARQEIYSSVATLTVDTDGRSPEEAAADILALTRQ
jgi:shikimate kinase